MRVVLDTNVLMSGIFFGGLPGRVLDAWSGGLLELVLSPEVLEEYQRVGAELADGYPARSEALAPILRLVAMRGILVAAPPLSSPVCDDPDDDKFLAVAIASRARVVVSGDKHLLGMSGWMGIEVCTPRQFVERHLG